MTFNYWKSRYSISYEDEIGLHHYKDVPKLSDAISEAVQVHGSICDIDRVLIHDGMAHIGQLEWFTCDQNGVLTGLSRRA